MAIEHTAIEQRKIVIMQRLLSSTAKGFGANMAAVEEGSETLEEKSRNIGFIGEGKKTDNARGEVSGGTKLPSRSPGVMYYQ